MYLVYLYNTTDTAIILQDIGIVIPPHSYYEVRENATIYWTNGSLYNAIENDSIVLNNDNLILDPFDKETAHAILGKRKRAIDTRYNDIITLMGVDNVQDAIEYLYNVGGAGLTKVFNWEPSTAYEANVIVINPNDNTLYRVIADYTSGLLIQDDILIALELVGGGSGSATVGYSYITNITPTNPINNVGDKITSSDGVVLDSCLTDTELVTVSVMALPAINNYKPTVTLYWGVNSIQVPLVAEIDKPLFTGSIAVDLLGETNLIIEHEDGAQNVCIINRDAKPIILSAYFSSPYPGTQTELKAGDIMGFDVEADIPFIRVEFEGSGTDAFINQDFVVAEATVAGVSGIIANRVTSHQLLGTRVRVQKSTGTWSDWYNTLDDGVVELTNVVNLNDLRPTVSLGVITYPGTQGALKNIESAFVACVAANYSSVLYTSPNGQISIVDDAIFAASKEVSRLAGDYNVSVNNLRLTVFRAANGSSAVANTIVFIANVAATLSVSEPASRLISGGNDGTTQQNHLITITSSQRLLNAPTLNAPVGTWQGVSFSWGATATTFTRNIGIHDNMVKGTYSWGAIEGTNLAGIITSAIAGDGFYTLGGFVTRIISLEAFANEANMNVEATNYANVAMTWSFKALPNKRAVGTTTVPDADSWCLHTLNTNPTIIRILDTAAAGSSSSASTITIQETV